MDINKIYNIDCMEGMSNMSDKSVNMTITDIPYGEVNRKSNGLRGLDKDNADVFTMDMEELLREVRRVTEGQIIIFCGMKQFSEIYTFFSKEKGTTRPIIWQKTNPSPMNGQHIYLSGVEVAVWFKPRGRKVFNAHCKNTVFKHSNGKKDFHPTQKNIKLFEELILDNSNEHEIIFDPFSGSATTAIACINTNRNFLGFELSKEYADKSNERIKSHLSNVK